MFYKKYARIENKPLRNKFVLSIRNEGYKKYIKIAKYM